MCVSFTVFAIAQPITFYSLIHLYYYIVCRVILGEFLNDIQQTTGQLTNQTFQGLNVTFSFHCQCLTRGNP